MSAHQDSISADDQADMAGLAPSLELVGVDLSVEAQILPPFRVLKFALDLVGLLPRVWRRIVEIALDQDHPPVADGGQAPEPERSQIHRAGDLKVGMLMPAIVVGPGVVGM